MAAVKRSLGDAGHGRRPGLHLLGLRNEAASPALAVDIDRVLCDLNRSFNPLHQDFLLDFRVAGARDGYVYLSIALPEGMTRVFVSMLESLHGFFRFIDLKSRAAVAESKPVDPAELIKRQQEVDALKNRICSVFDEFTDQGHPIREAIKRTNAALKAENHPWANHETVSAVLRAAKRLRKRR